MKPKLSDTEVIEAIRAKHLKANIAVFEKDPRLTVEWSLASVDPGGTIFGRGPYLHVPITGGDMAGIVKRVYAPERLRKQLASRWVRVVRTGKG